MKVLKFFSALILAVLLVVFGFSIGNSVSGLLAYSEGDANEFMRKNNMTYQQAYEQLKQQLDEKPALVEKVYVVDGEFFFPIKEEASKHHYREYGYYLHPQTGKVRKVDTSNKLMSKEGSIKNAGGTIKTNQVTPAAQ